MLVIYHDKYFAVFNNEYEADEMELMFPGIRCCFNGYMNAIELRVR